MDKARHRVLVYEYRNGEIIGVLRHASLFRSFFYHDGVVLETVKPVTYADRVEQGIMADKELRSAAAALFGHDSREWEGYEVMIIEPLRGEMTYYTGKIFDEKGNENEDHQE